MVVVWSVSIVAVMIGLYILVVMINDESLKRYKYEFFSYANLAITAVAYLLLYFGYRWYQSELSVDGDLLNGALLMLFGLILLMGILYNHIKRSSILFGLVVGVFQLILYIPLSFFSIFGVLLVAAWLFETKPVYRL